MPFTASDEALLRLLPEPVRRLMRPALIALDGVTPLEEPPLGAAAALDLALERARFPKGRRIGPPDELDPTCRAMAELLASRSGVDSRYAFPRTRWARQRWLGLAPPTRAELPVEYGVDGGPRRAPLYVAVGELREDPEQLQAVLARLPLTERLDAMGGLAFGAYRVEAPPPRPEELPTDRAAWAGTAAWAAAFADRLTALWADDVPLIERGNRWVRPNAHERWAIFLALSRTGSPVEPRWDWLLPISGGSLQALTEEVAALLPEPRRGEAIAQALEDDHDTDQLAVGRVLLRRFPSLPLVERLIAAADACVDELFTTPRRQVLTELAQELEDHAALREVVSSHLRTLPPLPILQAGRVFRVEAVEDLSPSMQRQFDILARGWHTGDGVMVEGPEDAPVYREISGVVAYEILDGDGRLVYEALLHSTEDGAVCEAGTLRCVASASQRNLDCNAGGPLLEALQELLSTPPSDEEEHGGAPEGTAWEEHRELEQHEE